MRKLTKTLAVMSLLAPASAYSLGIGSIKVHSGLNENLNAEIALIRAANEDVADIKISLAPPAKFDEAGIPWSAFLSKIKLEPVVKANGSTVIKISSNEVLKESFLDFLLEVSWPKGSLYREFTVLLEPPVYQKVSTSPVQTYQSFEEAPQPVIQQPRQRVVTHRPRHRAVYVDRRHNVTRKHDTLWKVAERVRKDGEPTVEQMMIAIYEANPQAFYKNNINALLPNKKLDIPKKEDVLSLPQDQALVAFNEQMRAWKNNEPVPVNKEVVAPAEETVVDKQLTLVAPTDAAVANDSTTSVAHDSASKPDKTADEKSKEGDANGQSGEAESGVNVVAPDQDVKTDKVTELEKQLATMQKNLEQKEQQLKIIQNGGKPLPVVPENQTPTNAAEVVLPTLKKPELPKPLIVKPAIKTPTQSPLVETPVTDTTPVWLVGIGGGLLALIGWLWWRKRKFNEQFDGESMFAPSSMIKPDQAAIRPVNKAATNTPSAIAAGSIEDNSFLNEFTASDFEVFDTSHVEIDPISETDVYLAYGRYQQAEELMRQAIKDQPDNDEYKLKLLEIFCATERKKDFVNYATELAAAGKKGQAEFWAKVTEMGEEVWSDLTLTSGGDMFIPENDAGIENIYTHLAPPAEQGADDTVAVHDTDLIDNDSEPEEHSHFHVATFDSDFEESLMGAESELYVPYDADEGMSEFNLNSDIDSDAVDQEVQNNNSIEFDLGSLGGSAKNNTVQLDNTQQEPADFSPDKTELTLDDAHEVEMFDFTSAHDNLEAFDEFSLDSQLLSPDNKSQDTLEIDKSYPLTLDTDPKSYEVIDDFDFDFDMDATSAATQSNTQYLDEADAGFDFMDLDELETKLDLAKAYIDMGDADAAKGIIAEVLDKGNADQIKTARNLFDSLV
ncbi:FimV/HubP family polar landmark protein [Crenothrix sp.]|uniref:FimV/HubP family polar landmark protein n=1 Tax=Crenothrix sp. TaxID=3100433 RepID=UPI00374D9BAB